MAQPNGNSEITNGDPVPAAVMPAALTKAPLVFEDGATQVFKSDGSTVYDDHGQTEEGTWSVVEDGKYASFWPPAYRSTYAVSWIVEGSAIVGLTFVEVDKGDRYAGRYQ
ncbi:hypothetical protein [Actinoplanes sp. TBRC 11911]|uniref:hypothetical protein n=1 Tax=Actinoplanes sp. TBRC 11911 TaxID=2729386 RepID=UPI002007085D|nr:hypothetical protein [Actinoplanes sp. TBRC 11911]